MSIVVKWSEYSENCVFRGFELCRVGGGFPRAL
jgi:hypothetical protein